MKLERNKICNSFINIIVASLTFAVFAFACFPELPQYFGLPNAFYQVSLNLMRFYVVALLVLYSLVLAGLSSDSSRADYSDKSYIPHFVFVTTTILELGMLVGSGNFVFGALYTIVLFLSEAFRGKVKQIKADHLAKAIKDGDIHPEALAKSTFRRITL